MVFDEFHMEIAHVYNIYIDMSINIIINVILNSNKMLMMYLYFICNLSTTVYIIYSILYILYTIYIYI